MMYEDLPLHSSLYRATSRRLNWSKLLKGEGAYFTNGGRYNVIAQPTVYASDDPMVAVSEYCYYESRKAQRILGKNLSPLTKFPLLSEHYLWCFTLTKPTKLINLMSPISRHAFTYSPSILTIPSQEYGATQTLANTIRGHTNPASPIAGGVRAPSVRTLDPHGVSTQIVLFPRIKNINAILVEQCNLTVEFLDVSRGQVTAQTEYIDWSNPRIQIHGGNNAASLISGCLGGASIPRLSWQTISIRFV